MKTVQNSLYATGDGEVLFEVRQKVEKIEKFLDEKSVRICGIPTHLKQVKKKKYFTPKNVKRTATETLPKVVPLDSNLDLDEVQISDEPGPDLPLLQTEYVPYFEGMSPIFKLCLNIPSPNIVWEAI